MNGNKINECISSLNTLLIPNAALSNTDREELLNFFVEEKIKSIVVYNPDVYAKAQNLLAVMPTKKHLLLENNQYESLARLRDIEKTCKRIIQLSDELKYNNIHATFRYERNELSLFFTHKVDPNTIEEIEKMGLHIINFSHVLDITNN